MKVRFVSLYPTEKPMCLEVSEINQNQKEVQYRQCETSNISNPNHQHFYIDNVGQIRLLTGDDCLMTGGLLKMPIFRSCSLGSPTDRYFYKSFDDRILYDPVTF